MKLHKIVRLALNMLFHSKLRSWLTIIGIVIGVAAVVAIVSIGQGLQKSVASRISGLGQDIVTISSGGGRAFGGAGGGGGSSVTNLKPLSIRDVQSIRLVPGVKYINPIVSGREDVYYNSETASVSIQGVDSSVFKEFLTTTLESGRYLGQGESRTVVLGHGLATTVFKNDIAVGYSITINDIPFRVVGILASSSGFGGGDNVAYVSLTDARDILSDTSTLKADEFSTITVKVDNSDYVQQTSDAIEEKLTNTRHTRTDKKDFSVSSPSALQARFSEVASSITIFLGVIAAVSLIVGAIGVANTMFTSVLERTKDIGIMKAIGAKNRDILLLFLINAGLLGLVGGLIGAAFGVGISYALPAAGVRLGIGGAGGGDIQTAISTNLIIFTLLFSLLIGMIAGAIPAWRGSRLKPIEALRYE